MPCEDVTIPAPARPNIQTPSIEEINTRTNEVEVLYSLTNTGNAKGSREVKITLDVGNTGTVDLNRTEKVAVGQNSRETRMVLFSLELEEDTEATLCIE